jgi:serine/threonine-protein kinase
MIGTTLQNYYIEALLGEGGMGRVYKATDTVLGRQVAVKSLNVSLTHQPSFLERFQNEAKILARLTHPNIAVLYNYLKENDNYYMVMEYVEGENLDDLTKQHMVLPYRVVVPVMLQALEGLEHAHKKGVLHRDIKPANLMLTPECQVKLMDFGIARVSGHAKLTQTSRVIGTLEFLAPELIEGQEPAPASDIYAAGVTMYEMLTGKLPFTGKSDYMLMQEIVKEKPVAPVSLSGTVPEALSEIILKALEKKPENRFQTAAAFSTALQTAFPELKNIPADFWDQAKPARPAARTLQATVVAAAPATKLYRESPATQLAGNDIRRITIGQSLLKNRMVYIAAAALLVIAFTMFRAFTPAPETKSEDGILQDTTIFAQGGTEDISTVDNTLAEDDTGNDEAVNFIVNKKKQEEQQQKVVTIKPDKGGNKDKQPAPKKPEQKIVQQAQNTETPKPTPSRPEKEDDDTDHIVAGQPIKLRGRGLPVMLVLQESINKQTANEGQHVSFKVVEPAMLKGTVIIPSGSVISGTIKGLGSHRMSIIFNTVNAKGKKMRLERSEAGASMSNVFSGNAFRVNLRGILTP